MNWRSELQSFSRARIKHQSGSRQQVPVQRLEISSFRDVLPIKSVGILIGSPFPRVIGVCEEYVDAQSLRHLLVVGKLSSVVEGERMQISLERQQHPYDGVGDTARPLVVKLLGPRNACHSVVYGDDCTLVALADDRISLQVPEAFLPFDNGRPCVYIHPVGYDSSILVLGTPLGLVPAFPSQMRLHLPSALLVSPNHLVDCLVANAVDAVHRTVALDLLGTPVQAQFCDDGFAHLFCKPAESRSRPLP